ncbi:MAG: tetratricopeptide repeat protein [Chloroflexi bacterium]|nr:tetratricopeptide repeat protein [Chloroflexota bacterium]
MAMVSLSNVVADARHALESGDYPLARATCRHVLNHYPSYADLHRLHGEILLEQGDTEGARQSFDTALSFDPQNVLATLGLGVIAEEGLDLAGAATAFQRALEIDPALTQLRDELVRLYSKLYGTGGRLHVSGPGLAAIYARGNQLTLARREYESLSSRHPDRLDLLLALVEVRWRSGDLAGAEALCHRVLAMQSTAVHALYIMADISHRQGRLAVATEHLRQAVAIDPTGDVARLLAVYAPGQTLAGAIFSTPEIPAFDPSSVPVETSPTTNSLLGVAGPPAEDSEWQRVAHELTATAAAMPPPMTAPPVSATRADVPPVDELARPWDAATSELAPRPEAGGDDLLLASQPAAAVVVATGATAVAAIAAVATATAHDPDSVSAPEDITDVGNDAIVDESPVDITQEWDHANAELVAATPDTVSAPGYTDALREIDELGVTPFRVETGPLDSALPAAPVVPPPVEPVYVETAPVAAAPVTAPPPVAPAPLAAKVAVEPVVASNQEAVVPADSAAVTSVGLRQLVANWDDIDQELSAAMPDDSAVDLGDLVAHLDLPDVAPFRIGSEPLTPVAAVAATIAGEVGASSSTPMAPGFTQELRALDAEGIAPFDFGDLDLIMASPAPRPTAPPAEPDLGGELDSTWADLEAQLNAAVPQTTTLPPGLTSELRALDAAGLAPFRPTGTLDTARLTDPTSPVSGQVGGLGAAALDQALPATGEAVSGDDLDALSAMAMAGPMGHLETTDLVDMAPIVSPVGHLETTDLMDLALPEAPPAVLAAGWDAHLAGAVEARQTPSPPAPVAPEVILEPERSVSLDELAPPMAAAQPVSRPAPPRPPSGSSLLRPSIFGATISLSGSLFSRLHQQKADLIARGEVVLRRVEAAPAASAASAVQVAEDASDLEPTDAMARRQLADAYATGGQPVEAAANYRLLLRSEPAMLGELAAPIQALGTSYPDVPSVTRLVGDLYLRQGRYRQAMDVFRRLIEPIRLP